MFGYYFGAYRVKLTDDKWQVIYRPDYTVVHECGTCAGAIEVALSKAGLKFAKPDQVKEDTQC
jgi:hypothetical protein